VLARLQGSDGDLGMRVAGRADINKVDVWSLDQTSPAGLRRVPAEFFGGLSYRVRVPSRYGGHLRGAWQPEEVRSGSPGMRMGGAHEAVAGHANS
jgi:hypothetical protein